MKVCFVLPKSQMEIVGGYKIVYEYANRLTEHGIDVMIMHLNSRSLKRYHIPTVMRRAIMDTIMRIEPRWFPLSKEVKKISDFSEKSLELVNQCDAVVATAVSTASFVNKLPETVKKCYFIQGFENWSVSESELYKTYGYGMRNYVVSNWLKSIVDAHSEKESILLSNPIDDRVYREVTPYSLREGNSVGVLYNPNECKGFDYALKAIVRLKELFPDLTVKVFGSFSRPKSLPKWIQYKKKASQQETVALYNSVRVFLCASIDEGFGLTGYEAMACGCVLVTSNFQGAMEYVCDGENALVSERKDVEAMVRNVSKVFADDKLAICLSENGKKTVSQTTWDSTISKFLLSLKE